MSLWLQVFAALCLYSYNPPGVVAAAASNFRGGHITWKPISPGNPDQPKQVSYKLHIYSSLHMQCGKKVTY